MSDDAKKILFAGGGTMGPVSPLFAIKDTLEERHPNLIFHWVGTKNGPEKRVVAGHHIAYDSIITAKLHRFFSLKNLLSPFTFLIACMQAARILKKQKPDMVIAAGAFVAVPVIWMARLMNIPSHIHQLDIRPGLANRLIAPFASLITVSFEPSIKAFKAGKTVWTGAPVRQDIAKVTTNKIHLKKDLPAVLIFGGGTGAQGINQLVQNSWEVLAEHCQVIHLYGKGKQVSINHAHYHGYAFLRQEMAEAYAKADIVISRAGIATITELSFLKKPAIILPLPDSHQEDNATMLENAQAAVILNQNLISPQEFAMIIIQLLRDRIKKEQLAENIGTFYIPDATQKIVDKIDELLYDKASQT